MVKKLKFQVVASRTKTTQVPQSSFSFATDNWDDFGYKVQFHLTYTDEDGKTIRLGVVKILKKINQENEPIKLAEITKLPNDFSCLDESFISLGQEDKYYKNIYDFFGPQSGDILDALRDIAWQPAFATDFEPTSAFRNAMMRENGAHRARRFGAAWATGESVHEELAFIYNGLIDGADTSVEANFHFDPEDPIPGRIVGIIGRNAVGKTRFLAGLGADLAQISRASAERLVEREERFPEGRPLFTRIIAISYSAFDRFKRPPSDSSSSYVYCGIRNEKGALSRAYLVETYLQNQKRIRDRGVESDWTEYMQIILGDLSEQLTTNLQEEINSKSDEKALSLLSSGQSILAHFVTALLAWIQPNSLVLFDEPETHLHPNAVASLFQVLTEILKRYDSYAVVATHSPVVIQEIPSNRVLVFKRDGNVTTSNTLPIESFGESVTELTKHVFETIEIDNAYRRTLKKLIRVETIDEVMARFENGLSLSAQAYLLAQYGKKVGKKSD